MDIAGSVRQVQRLEEFTFHLEEEGDLNNSLQAQRTLVGKGLTDKSLNRGAIKHILSKAWGDP